jgi:hypothetical protein
LPRHGRKIIIRRWGIQLESMDLSTKGHSLEQAVVRVRCPNCIKLYAVDAAEIAEAKPQFECAKCQTRFWFPFPASLSAGEILGFPLAWLEEKPATEPLAPVERAPEPARMFSCPRCQANYGAGDTECPKCGVVFSKIEMSEEMRSVSASSSLRRLWHQVMDNYAVLPGHRKFVHACQRENNLVFASQQYARVLKAHSGDETALQMQKEISALAVTIGGVARTPKSFSFIKLMPRLTTILMVIGGVVIGLGFIIPDARNLIGLGASMVFFMLAVDWFFSQN